MESIESTLEYNESLKKESAQESLKKKIKSDSYITYLDGCLLKLRKSKFNLKSITDDKLSKPIPLIKCFVGTLKNVKDISKAILILNDKLPLKELQHLKRARKKQIILCMKEFLGDQAIEDFLKLNITELKDSFEAINEIEVPAHPVKTKIQYENSIKVWPCNFHPNKYYEKLVSDNFFETEELFQHKRYMEIVFDVVKFYFKTSNDNTIDAINATIVVDPTIQSIVAIAFDNRNIHPIQHAAMLAIDNVAKTQNGGAWIDSEKKLNGSLKGIDGNLYECLKKKYPNMKCGSKPFRSKKDMPNVESNDMTDCGPYLCTGYDVYLLREPCIMCSMSLVHARVKRVFYCLENRDFGGLKSRVKLQTISSLNHRFEVFTGFI